MTFVPLKPKNDILKIADLYGKWLIGKYLQKQQTDYSFIYFLETEDGKVTKIYGSKSLDPYMDDALLGETLAITCSALKDTGKGHLFGVATVAKWDPNAQDDETPVAAFNQKIPKP
ncbi:MAG: hypothetical protein V4654_14130 [Bdellovibrionota bacterium]